MKIKKHRKLLVRGFPKCGLSFLKLSGFQLIKNQQNRSKVYHLRQFSRYKEGRPHLGKLIRRSILFLNALNDIYQLSEMIMYNTQRNSLFVREVKTVVRNCTIARNCAELRAILRSLQGSQLRASKIHLRRKR